jgi:hypothetical protein
MSLVVPALALSQWGELTIRGLLGVDIVIEFIFLFFAKFLHSYKSRVINGQ